MRMQNLVWEFDITGNPHQFGILLPLFGASAIVFEVAVMGGHK